jgi:hypothetical protein
MFTGTKNVLNFQIEVSRMLVSIPTDTVPQCTIMVRLLHVTILTRIHFGAIIKIIKFFASVTIVSPFLSLSLSLSLYIYIYMFSRKMYLKLVRLKFFTEMVAKFGITPWQLCLIYKAKIKFPKSWHFLFLHSLKKLAICQGTQFVPRSKHTPFRL